MLNVLAQKYDKTPKPELDTHMVHLVFTVYCIYIYMYTHMYSMYSSLYYVSLSFAFYL